MSALIQNFDTVEKAIETSANSAGSALKENERYLDSIQGKIDQFNNAVQSMWSNFLDADVIKNIVAFGTELVKIVDTLGLIPSLLITIGAYKGFGALFQTLSNGGLTIKALTASLWNYLTGAEAVNAVNIKQIVTDNILRANWIQSLATQKLKEIQEKKLAAAKAHLNFVQTRYIIGVGTAEQVERAEMLVKEASVGVDINKISTTELLSLAFKKLAANIWATIKALIPLAVAGLAIWGITEAVDALAETTKELKDEYDELNNTLDETKNKLSDIDSQLNDIENKIQEINSQESLSFADEEELQRLKAQTVELNRQKELYETLQGQQATQVNASAIKMAHNYANVGVNSGKTTEDRAEGWGKGVAIAGGIGGGIAAGALKGSALLSWAGPWGIVIGAAIGAIAGGVIGAGIGTVLGEAEDKVGDSLDNMKSEYERLQSEYETARANYQANASDKNKKKFEKAQEAFSTYQSNMADYMTEMDSYYSQIKQNWDQATTEQKQEYIEWQDTMDTWAIQTGGTNAKSNMFARIFGDEAEGNFAKVRDRIAEIKEEIKEAQDFGDETALEEAMAKLESFEIDGLLSDEDVARIRELGAYLYEAEDYFKDVIKAESDFVDLPLEDVAKDINSIADGLDSLKEAFDEVVDKGYLTYKTLLSLQESLGGLLNLKSISETDDKEVLTAWKTYQELMMSGAATTEQMTDATEDLAKAILDKALEDNNLKPETKWEYIVQLQGLGVENAQEYVEELLRKNMITELEGIVGTDRLGAIKDAFLKEFGDTESNREWFDSRSQEQIEGYAKKYGIVDAQITDAHKQEIMERYGVDDKYVDAVIDLLEQKAKKQQEIDALTAESEAYQKWLNSSDKDNLGVKALEEDIKKVEEMLDGFNLDDWEMYSNWGSFRYKDKNGNELLSSEYEALKKKYEGYLELQQQYNQLIEEGRKNGWVDDNGKILNIDFAEELSTARGELQNFVDDIANLSPELQLKLNLQNFNEGVDKIQDVYSTLKNIATEYNLQGYLSLDNLQALLNLSPEYLAVLQMENGQLTINQSALQSMLETKLDDAKATAVQTAITQLNALAQRKEQSAIDDTSGAIDDAMLKMGSYSEALGTIAQTAIGAAGSISLFNAALKGATDAKDSGLVTDDEINQILTNFNNSVNLIDSVRANLSSNFNQILDPGSKTSGEDVAAERFQKEMDYWENRIAANQAKYEQLQNEIDLLEKKGKKADASFYREQIELENERKHLLEQQKEAALARLQAIEAAGGEGNEQWWETAEILNSIESELDDVTASIVDLQDAIGEIDTYKFEEFNNRLDDITSKLGTIRDLIAPNGDEDWFNDQGEWTEEGVAVLGTYIQELETYKNGIAETAKTLEKYQSAYVGNESYYENLGIHSEQEYYDKVEELTNQQYDYASSISDTEQSVVDMYESSIDAIEEYMNTLIEGYNDYIDSVKEALDAERDLYDFKKNVQKQAKDIAKLERRIASLSGSTNAADIAERRKLEAELYENRESLNETYYDHAQDAQNEALDAERTAYEETANRFVRDLRKSLDEATANMDEFLMGVTSMVMYNADTILAKYEETNLPLTTELTNPWIKAKEAVGDYSGNALDLMNQWTKEGGFFAQFNTIGTTNLESPWEAGKTAAGDFQTSVSGVMTNVVSNITKNVETASGELSKLYQQIIDTEKRAAELGVPLGGGDPVPPLDPPDPKTYSETAYLQIGYDIYSASGTGTSVNAARENATDNLLQKVIDIYKSRGDSSDWISKRYNTWKSNIVFVKPTIPKALSSTGDRRASMYAKGTTGTPRDEWAITDEFGPELKMYATPEGNLSFMALGSTVVPHDLTMDLIELPSVVDGLINRPNFDSGINMISNAINKPEIKLDIENFLNVGRVDQDTLPALEKMMDKKINEFSRQLNYALKGKGAR